MKHRYPTQPTLSTLRATCIHALVQRFCRSHPPAPLPFVPCCVLSPQTPCLSTLVYRLHRISDARWQQLLGWLAQQGLALEDYTTDTPHALSGSRLRARARAEQHSEVLRGRYRIEQVFGGVKGVYGSYVGAVSWLGARSWVWGMWILWNIVGLERLGGEFLFRFVLCVVTRYFRTPSLKA